MNERTINKIIEFIKKAFAVIFVAIVGLIVKIVKGKSNNNV